MHTKFVLREDYIHTLYIHTYILHTHNIHTHIYCIYIQPKLGRNANSLSETLGITGDLIKDPP